MQGEADLIPVFRVDHSDEHQRLVRSFETWEDRATPLTLVHGVDGVATLVDEEGAVQ